MLTFTFPDNTRKDHPDDQCNREDYKHNIRFFQVHWFCFGSVRVLGQVLTFQVSVVLIQGLIAGIQNSGVRIQNPVIGLLRHSANCDVPRNDCIYSILFNPSLDLILRNPAIRAE